MASAFFKNEMVSDDVLGMQDLSGRRGKRCHYCKAVAVDPPVLTIDPQNLYDRFLCEACWLLPEIGFSDARPYDGLYQYLTPLDRRLRDAAVYHFILRGRVLLERQGDLVK
jgi:hypothetical protein